jgi:hypothetical protein
MSHCLYCDCEMDDVEARLYEACWRCRRDHRLRSDVARVRTFPELDYWEGLPNRKDGSTRILYPRRPTSNPEDLT